MQLDLAFLEIPNPRTTLWQALEETERHAALEVLARLIAQAARPGPSAEDHDND
ncbi:MAG: hypothetical protein ACE5HT_17210 [Gemmatimonadales bacterium]